MTEPTLLCMPKGQSWFCEVCRRPGTLKCLHCQTTYYCSEYHKVLDWKAFHKLVCNDLAYIRGDHPFPIEEAERKIIKKKLRNLQLEIRTKAQRMAKEYILKQNAEFAFFPAMQSSNLSKDLFGDEEDLESVLPNLLLCEVYLALGHTEMAKKFMQQAAYSTENEMKVPVDLLMEVHRVKGLVYLANKKFKRANESFSEYVYCIAKKHGTSGIPISIGFGYLGISLFMLKKPEGQGLYNKMANMWVHYLLDHYISGTLKIPTVKEMENLNVWENEILLLEAISIFKRIDKTIQDLKPSPQFDQFLFQFFLIQALICIRNNLRERKEECCTGALVVATRTRMDSIIKEERRAFVNEILGDDYLLRWDKKNKRIRTIATVYLEHVKNLGNLLDSKTHK